MRMTTQSAFVLPLAVLLSVFSSHAAVLVTNVTVSQREGTKLVDISYDVQNEVERLVTVNLKAFRGTNEVVLTSLSGSIGSNVVEGVGKAIVWDGGADLDRVFTNITFSLTAVDDPPYQTPRQIKYYSFELKNTKGDWVDSQFWLRVPVKQTSYQKVTALGISHPYELIEDADGNQTLYFTGQLAPYEIRLIRVKIDYDISQDPEQVSFVNPSNYLSPELYMEFDDPVFIALAPSFSSGDSTVIASNAMNWINSNITYESTSYISGALGALQNRRGDGTEMSYLFAAICRAHGIPARVFAGYVIPSDTIITPNTSYQNFAEFFDGEKWILVDVNDRVFGTGTSSYLALFVMNGAGPLTRTQRYGGAGDGLSIRWVY